MIEDAVAKATSDALVTILNFVTLVLIPYCAILLRSWVKEKTARIKDQNLREGIEFAFDRLDKTAGTAVNEIEQIIKARLKNGMQTSNDLALKAATAKVFKRLPAPALATFQKNYTGDEISNLVIGKIKSKVRELKRPVCP